ncbi:hypothetical protein AAC387_Pa02g2502 [Persea americana]
MNSFREMKDSRVFTTFRERLRYLHANYFSSLIGFDVTTLRLNFSSHHIYLFIHPVT